MSIVDKIFGRPSIKVIYEAQNEATKRIDEQITEASIERIRETVKDVADAIEAAESKEAPDRKLLFNLYKNMELDEHIQMVVQTIFYRIIQTDFRIYDGENENEEKKLIFQKPWFVDFCQYFLEADYWMFSLIQLIKDGENITTENVNRYHVRPEEMGITKKQDDTEIFIDYSKPPYDTLMFIPSRVPLGRYSTIAKRFVLKREVVQFWAIYNELFTTPYFWAKTKLSDKKHKQNLIDAFKNRKHSGFQVIGEDDELNAVANGGQGWASYDKFEDKANEAISKGFLGQTMVAEDGSSRSQAEVHERQLQSFINAKLFELETFINETLIIKQSSLLGFNGKEKFKWDLSESFTLTQWVDLLAKLSMYYTFDLEKVSEKLGIDTELKSQIPVTTDTQLTSMLNKLKTVYK